MLALGFLVWSLAAAVTGLVHGFLLLVLMRVVLGMGESVTFPCYSKILARHLPEHQRGFAKWRHYCGHETRPGSGHARCRLANDAVWLATGMRTAAQKPRLVLEMNYWGNRHP